MQENCGSTADISKTFFLHRSVTTASPSQRHHCGRRSSVSSEASQSSLPSVDSHFWPQGCFDKAWSLLPNSHMCIPSVKHSSNTTARSSEKTKMSPAWYSDFPIRAAGAVFSSWHRKAARMPGEAGFCTHVQTWNPETIEISHAGKQLFESTLACRVGPCKSEATDLH